MTIDLRLRASDDLLIACQELIDSNELTTAEDVKGFFEKPWHWEKELKSLNVEVRTE